MMWLDSAARLDRTLARLLELARERGPDGRRIGDGESFREELASLYVDAQAMWFMGYRGFAKFARAQISPELSVLKLFGIEINQCAARVATEVLGVDALDVVGVDDHVREPPDTWERHLSAKRKSRAPRLVHKQDGSELWVFEGQQIPNVGLNAVAGTSGTSSRWPAR